MTDFEAKSKALAEKYPKLFSEIGMAWVGMGWLDLIDEMSQAISTQFPDTVYLQIKEKFAWLRVYATPMSKELQELINTFEKRSKTICEECGEQGEVINHNGWLKTRCKTHR